jgi:chaperonin GroEL (HSP60 family)
VDANVRRPAADFGSALQNAASIASLMLTTEVLIGDKSVSAKPAAPGSDSGGMY